MQTNAEVRNSAPPPCTRNQKHGRVKQLFSTQTRIQSLSRMARCACMTMRRNHEQVSHRMTAPRPHKNVPQTSKHCTRSLTIAPTEAPHALESCEGKPCTLWCADCHACAHTPHWAYAVHCRVMTQAEPKGNFFCFTEFVSDDEALPRIG